MENSCQNYPERLGYCFHSNGLYKKRCVFSRSAEMHLGFLLRQNYDGKLLDGGQNNKSSLQFDH
jgi:hypothetical protein